MAWFSEACVHYREIPLLDQLSAMPIFDLMFADIQESFVEWDVYFAPLDMHRQNQGRVPQLFLNCEIAHVKDFINSLNTVSEIQRECLHTLTRYQNPQISFVFWGFLRVS